MTLLRRFLVLQALMLWQGGFLFYAAIVVPTGTDELGSFAQGRVTRHVTDWMNLIGLATLAILAWDQWVQIGRCRGRWALWLIQLAMLATLFAVHPRIEAQVDFSSQGRIEDYPRFYFWHRVYLYAATAQWLAGLAYVAFLLRSWRNTDPD